MDIATVAQRLRSEKDRAVKSYSGPLFVRRRHAVQDSPTYSARCFISHPGVLQSRIK
jgi:hypothetical protein